MRQSDERKTMRRWRLCAAGPSVALVLAVTGTRGVHAEPAPVSSLAAPAASAPASSADVSVGAAQWMREGVELFARGQWEASRQAFLRAWELKQHHAVAANLAEVEIKLELWRDAAEHLRYALRHQPAARTDDRRVAETQLEECRRHLAAVAVRANREQATIRVDGKPVGHLPLSEPLWLEPGRHTLSVELAGHGPEEAELDLVAGQKTSVELELRPLAPPAPSLSPDMTPTPAPVRLRDATSPARTWVLIGGGVLTLAAVGMGVGYTLESDAARRDARRTSRAIDGQANLARIADTSGACVAPEARWAAQCAALESSLEESTNARRVAGVSFIAAGVFGAATVTTFLFWPRRRESVPAGRVRPVVGLGPGLGMVSVAGGF
jgi:hypothetical protein